MPQTKTFTMRLVELKRTKHNGQTFSKYMLMSISRRWYNISTSPEVSAKFDKLAGQIVNVEATRTYTKEDNGYTNTYIVVNDIVLADETSKEYKEFVQKEAERDAETLEYVE